MRWHKNMNGKIESDLVSICLASLSLHIPSVYLSVCLCVCFYKRLCVSVCMLQQRVQCYRNREKIERGWCKLISVSRLPLPGGKKFISHRVKLNTHTEKRIHRKTHSEKQEAFYYFKQDIYMWLYIYIWEREKPLWMIGLENVHYVYYEEQ